MDPTLIELIIYGFLGGVLPTLLWMWFWISRDKHCPEPRRYLIGAFMFGALSALLVIPFQGTLARFVPAVSFLAVVLFALGEESSKFLCANFSSLSSKSNNERIDPIIYLATTALGFAALENTLYIISFLNNFDLFTSLMEGGKRVFGATVLHTTASASIGIALAIAFKRSQRVRKILLVVGLAVAVGVHVLFNYLVTHNVEEYALYAFSGVWVLLIVVIVIVELNQAAVCPPEDY